MNLQGQYNKRGFSLIEIILVVSLLLVVTVGFSGFGVNFLNSNEIKNKTNELILSLRQAQLNSMSGKEDARWGVVVTTSPSREIKLYAEGVSTYDQSFIYSQKIDVTNFDVIFDKITGNPTVILGPALGNIIMISDSSGNSKIFTINSLGIINFN